LIRESEAELEKMNAAIDLVLEQADFPKLNSLYEEKSQLEKRIDLLYNEWIKNN
jgi:hypothetical protein